jgi:hypothetical protein
MANSLAGNNNTNSFIGNLSKVKNLTPIAEIDRVNVYEFENGMDVELTNLGGELTSENIRKSQSKVLKNLKKDPAFYTNKIAEETVKRFGEWGSGKKKQGKSATAVDAEKVKADSGKAKVKPTDAPFGTKEEVKGKYKSSGMEPAKKVKGSLKETMDYNISNQTTSTDPAEYRSGTTKGLEELDVDSDKAVRDTMRKQLSQPIKSWDQIVKDLAKDGKVKLTKENKQTIANTVASMVKEAVALKDKAGNIQYAKDSTEAGNTIRNAQSKGVTLTQSNV